MFLALSWEVLQNNKQFFRWKNQQTICLNNAFQLANKNVWNYKMTPRYYVKDFRYLRVNQCQSKYQVHSPEHPADLKTHSKYNVEVIKVLSASSVEHSISLCYRS